MGGPQRLQEMEFELALTSRLEDVYGLRVKTDGDPLNRRQNGYITLSFGYRYDVRRPGTAQVRVGIAGRKRPVFRFQVDLSDVEEVESVASECEDLALGIHAYLAKCPSEDGAPASQGRREDD